VVRLSNSRRREIRGDIDAKQMLAHANEAATFLRLLANEHRLAVMCCLLEGPLSVGEINARIELSQSALSQHLAVLREAGLVTTERRGQTIFYSVAGGRVRRTLSLLHDLFCAL
jgi:DNA-binding transcriptional ArsR family regulator